MMPGKVLRIVRLTRFTVLCADGKLMSETGLEEKRPKVEREREREEEGW